jgi:glutaredoxin
VQRRGIFSLYPSAGDGANFSGFWVPYAPGVSGATVLIYSRRTCGLCDKARAVILSERARTDFAFEEVFIDGDDDLERRYGLRVPVVSVNGIEEFEYEVEPVRFGRMVRDKHGSN